MGGQKRFVRMSPKRGGRRITVVACAIPVSVNTEIHLKHRNTLLGMYIPTEIHSQLKSYCVSGCYVSLRVLLTSIGGTRAESFSRFLLHLLGWRHLVNNLHTVAKMAAAILRHCSKNRETDSALVPPILVKTTHKES